MLVTCFRISVFLNGITKFQTRWRDFRNPLNRDGAHQASFRNPMAGGPAPPTQPPTQVGVDPARGGGSRSRRTLCHEKGKGLFGFLLFCIGENSQPEIKAFGKANKGDKRGVLLWVGHGVGEWSTVRPGSSKTLRLNPPCSYSLINPAAFEVRETKKKSGGSGGHITWPHL